MADNGNKVQPILHPRQAIELFHSHFLIRLDKAIPSEAYAIKGGCNLRMLLGSPRASEDLDIDIQQVAVHTLQKRVDAIKKLLGEPLAKKTVKLASFTEAKQTATVQRWKAELELLGQPIQTKIEFSRRGIAEKPERNRVVKSFQSDYQLDAVLSHYGPDTALRQKVLALAGRKVTQARDIFDAAFLLGRGAKAPLGISRSTAGKAEENTLSTSFSDYTGQVIPYLDEKTAEKFAPEVVWGRLRDTVAGLIRSIPLSPDPLAETGPDQPQPK